MPSRQINHFVKKPTRKIELVTSPDTRHHIQLVAKGAEVVGYTAKHMGIIKKKIPCLFHISSHILFILPGDIIAIAGGWDCALKGEASRC